MITSASVDLKPAVTKSESWPTVSIVVATQNRASQLERCLRALESLVYPLDRFEVIVVDDGSSDTTGQTLNAFRQATQLTFQNLTQSNRGPSAARNAGVGRADGEIIAFTDDDCVPDSGWLNALAHGLADASVGGVGGIIRDVARNAVSRYLELHHVVASDLSGERVPSFLITANAAYRRSVLMQAGGFDERFRHPGGEDPDLSYRVSALGYKLGFCADAVVHHFHKTGLREFARSYYYYGQGYGFVQQKHQLSGSPASAVQQVWRMLSPRGFGYRAKQYVKTNGARWPDALSYAFLDQVRELAWQWGYSRSKSGLG